jgi:hypothetical protein
MSDFNFVMKRLESLSSEVLGLAEQLAALKLARETDQNDLREHGHAIRDMTTVLERIVDVIDPLEAKND